MIALLHALAAWFLALFASLSNYTESAVANAYGNHTAFDITTPYTKLHTGDPGEDGANNAAANTTRKSTSFGGDSGGVIVTDALLEWTSVPADETYSYVSQWDTVGPAGGNCLGSGALTAPVAVLTGNTFQIPIGQLSLTIT